MEEYREGTLEWDDRLRDFAFYSHPFNPNTLFSDVMLTAKKWHSAEYALAVDEDERWELSELEDACVEAERAFREAMLAWDDITCEDPGEAVMVRIPLPGQDLASAIALGEMPMIPLPSVVPLVNQWNTRRAAEGYVPL